MVDFISGQLDARASSLLAEHPHLPVIDMTDRRRHKRCLRQWDLQSHLRRGLRPRLQAPPLLFGTLLHNALDYCYRTRPYNYEGAIGWFQGACGQSIAGIKAEYSPWPSEQEAYDGLLDLGVSMLTDYALWAPELDDFDVIESEHAGLVPVLASGEMVGLCYFRTDGIVRDNRDRLWVLEHKTCARWWTDIMLTLDEQATQYMWCEEQWFGEPVAGVLMNFLLKSSAEDPPLLKDGRPTTAMSRLSHVTSQRYLATVHGVIGILDVPPEYAAVYDDLVDREERGEHPLFRRVRLQRSRSAVAEQGPRVAAELLDMLRPGKVIYPSPDFTCGRCDVKTLCEQMEDGADWEFTANELYERSPALWEQPVEVENDSSSEG